MATQEKPSIMLDINEQYGTFIWGIANRYHTGIWLPEDVYQQILMMAYSAVCDGTLSTDESEHSVGRFKSFIITRAINLVRRENLRQGTTLKQLEARRSRKPSDYHDGKHEVVKMVNDRPSMEPEAPVTTTAAEFEKWLMIELLNTRLDKDTARFVSELTFPSDGVIEIAEKDRQEAIDSGGLRMNIHKLKVLPRHVAEYLKDEMGRVLPKVTISRMRKKAREELCDADRKTIKL